MLLPHIRSTRTLQRIGPEAGVLRRGHPDRFKRGVRRPPSFRGARIPADLRQVIVQPVNALSAFWNGLREWIFKTERHRGSFRAPSLVKDPLDCGPVREGMGSFPARAAHPGLAGCLYRGMTPNYFRMAQDLARAPKLSRANSYVIWALSYSPLIAAPRKAGPSLSGAPLDPKGKR